MRVRFEGPNAIPSAEAARRIDAVCDRFEQQLQEIESPDLGLFLEQVEEDLQPVLLRQLLLQQWDHDGRIRESIDLQPYLDQFPSHALLIQNAAVEHLTDLEQREQNFREAANKQQAAARMARRWEDSDYKILRRLGGGAMGSVWLAEERATKQLVALKILRHDLHSGPHGFHRFSAEVQALQKLDHPNIIRIRSVDMHLDEPFYTMEYCPGGSLADALRIRRFSAEESAKLIKTLAEAVHVAHQAGVVHRDLKPGNILLHRGSLQEVDDRLAVQDSADIDSHDEGSAPVDDYAPKLADFGLSKDLQAASLTHAEALIGSPPYMAPEQVENSKTVGRSVDIHALGTILYECLTGQPPFQGANPLLTIQQVVSRNVKPLTKCNPNIPKDLSAICLRCLEKNPAERYSTAGELADDLQRFLGGQPVRARQLGVGKLLGRFLEYPLKLTILVVICLASYVLASNWHSFAFGVKSLPSDAEATAHAAIQQWPSTEQFTFQGQASATASGKSTILSDQRIIVDTSMRYELSVYASAKTDGEQPDPNSLHYVGIVSYDIDGYEIRPWNFMKNPEAVDTTLARDLNPGDMAVSLTDATGWYDGPDGALRTLVWYGYENSRGDVYADYTYTRHTSLACWEQDAIDGNTIQLKVRWNGPALRAGEPVRNGWNSYQHNYRFLAPGHVSEQRQYLHALIGDQNLSGKINLSKFRPGTHSIAAFALADHTNTGTQLTLTDFTVTCLPRDIKKLVGY